MSAPDEWAAFSPQVLETGEQPTPDQAAYARANAQYRDAGARPGTAYNPSYDTPSNVGGQGVSHVTPGGQLVTPGADNDAWADFTPRYSGQLGRLPNTGAMRSAIADAVRAPGATDPGSMSVIDNFMFGRGPQFDAAAAYGDTALGNLLKRATGQHVPYGASDAYQATVAADQSGLNSWRAEHPAQGAVTALAGAGLNPANWAAGRWVAQGVGSLGPTATLLAQAGKSGVLGGLEGAAYGSSDSNDPVGGALRGAAYGGLTGAVAAPVALGGAGLTGGAVNYVRRLAAGPQASLGAAVINMTPEQIQAAQNLRMGAASGPVPWNLSLPEAVQQVTNGGTTLGRSLRVLEGTRQGSEILAPYFADRPEQIRGAVTNFADQIADPTTTPSIIGTRARTAAQGALDELRQNINAAADPHYQAMPGRMEPNLNPGQPPHYVSGPGQSIPLEQYQPLANNGAYQGALANVRSQPMLNAGIAHLPDHDISVVNEVVKELDRLGTASAQTATNPNGNNFVAAQYGNARGLADRIATSVSPQWRAARDTVSGGRQWLLDPVTAGPVGHIAAAPESVPAANAYLYPSAGSTMAGSPEETAVAMRLLNHQFPGVGGDLTRQHILMSLDGARPVTAQGMNPNLGVNFANSVAATPEQEATLLAGVRGVGPHGPGLAENLAQTLEQLRATGKRQPQGSGTAYNAEDLQQLHASGIGKVIKRLADPLEWGAGISDMIDRANWRRNVEGLANYYMSPADQTGQIILNAQAAAPPPITLGLPQLPYPATGALVAPRSSGATQRQ